MVATPSSVLSARARFGPRPGTLVRSRTPGGIRVLSWSTAAIVPSRRYSVILAAIDLPTPGIVVRAASGMAPMSSG